MFEKIKSINSIIFDFDGVFTDNFVYINEQGLETVRCSRSDGLGVANFKEFIGSRNLNIDLTVISTETNLVVYERSQKLDIPAFLGVKDKKMKVEELFKNSEILAKGWSSVLYIGNDTNDRNCIQSAGVSFAPVDAHPSIKTLVDFIGIRRGGDGFVRECLEYIEALLLREKT